VTFAYLALHSEPVATVAERAKGCRYIVAPFASLRSAPVAWWEVAKSTGAQLMAHVPVSYLRLEYGGDFYDRWKEMYQRGAALTDATCNKVVLESGECMIDLRSTGSPRDWCIYYASTLAYHARLLLDTFPRRADGSLDIAGFFLDMAVDSITWTGHAYANHAKVNAAWKEGTDRFLRTFCNRIIRPDWTPYLVGNGVCTSEHLDALAYEGFPQDWGWTRHIEGACNPRWHASAHPEHGPWCIPAGESPGGSGVTKEVLYQSAGFMAAFAPTGVLCVNDPAKRELVESA